MAVDESIEPRAPGAPIVLAIVAAICEPEDADVEHEEDGNVTLRIKSDMIPSVTFELPADASAEDVEEKVHEALALIQQSIMKHLLEGIFAGA